MPTAPSRICGRCRGTRPGTCQCAKREDRRKSAAKRGYDWTWRKWRERYLARHPLCQDCLPRVIPAVDIHHTAKLVDRPDLQYEETNVIGLCHACHSMRTAKGE